MTVGGATVLGNNRFWKMPLVEWSMKGGSHKRHHCPALGTRVIWRQTWWYTHSVPALFMTYYLCKRALWGVQPWAGLSLPCEMAPRLESKLLKLCTCHDWASQRMPGKFGGIRLMTTYFSNKTRLWKSQNTLCTVSSKLRNHLLQEFSRFENGLSERSNILHSGCVWRDDNTYQMSAGGCKFFMTVGGATVLGNNRFWKMPLVEWSMKEGSHKRHHCPALGTRVIWRQTWWYTHSVPALFMTYYLCKSALWGVQPWAYRAVLSGDDAPS